MAMQISDIIAENDDTTTSFVMHLLNNAILKNASDIHFEPYRDAYRVRFRIDGVLYEAAKTPLEYAQRCSIKLKIMAKLDISEKRLPQDGRFTFTLQNNETRDCRLSTCPTLFGEKLVIRILQSSNANYIIDDLGFDYQQQQLFLNAINMTQGMILVTGPTGSGKTITLYSALNLLSNPTKNISTVEDPIEIAIYGINQVEVNYKIGLTFAAALRTFLRQDPDIIMLGEIRDAETADIAIKASQTGHLVLSTLHTNSAVESIARLSNMGITTFNLASSVKLIIAQRLVRKICQYCKQEQHLTTTIKKKFGLPDELPQDSVIYSASGCDKCNNGYLGRTGVFEMLAVTADVADMILDNNNFIATSMTKANITITTMRQHAISKALAGITSLEEINRVVTPCFDV